MQKLTIKLEPQRKEDEIHGTFIVEEKRGTDWSRTHVKDVGVPSDSEQTILIRDNQRLIFEPAIADDKLVYDREQGAAVNPRTQKAQDVVGADKPNPNDKVEKVPPQPLPGSKPAPAVHATGPKTPGNVVPPARPPGGLPSNKENPASAPGGAVSTADKP